MSTVDAAKSAGLSPCSGLIAGMGETDEDLVDVAFALRALSPDSVPVNFLIPFDGTPLAGQWELTPQRCLRILAMVRFVCPSAEVRLAGGCEIHLRSLQPLALHVVNSIFLGDYLTSEGQPGAADLAMIAHAGFTVEGAGNPVLAASPPRPRLLPRPPRCRSPSRPLETPRPELAPADSAAPDLVHVPPPEAPAPTLPANTCTPRHRRRPGTGAAALGRGRRDSVVVAVGVPETAPLVEGYCGGVAGLHLRNTRRMSRLAASAQTAPVRVVPRPARLRAGCTSTAVIPAQPSAIESRAIASTSRSARMLANAWMGAEVST